MIKINFLGTADQIPSAKRNHSAILLTYNEENILVDCGEGTQRQFRKARLNPCKITRILITHLHGDHVLGLPGLLSTLALSGYNKILFIYGPKGTKLFMKDLLRVFGFKKNYKIFVEEVDRKFFETDDFFLESEKMKHGIPCNAYCFVKKGQRRIDKNKLKKSGLPLGPLLQKLKQGKNISYEGKKYLVKNLTFKEDDKKISFVLDTLDNKEIVPFVKNSDLLVCESNFGSDLQDQAKEHLHLTSTQAGEIAKKSKSKKLVLTHISQRYENNFKKILDEAKKVFKNSFVAKDLDDFEVE
ncbi:ribonuclease Z [Candidatus Pacearchaeota archaeon]|nr:ribonuclease Z [Candidatus Pacearchaeota archaeon]